MHKCMDYFLSRADPVQRFQVEWDAIDSTILDTIRFICHDPFFGTLDELVHFHKSKQTLPFLVLPPFLILNQLLTTRTHSFILFKEL